MISQTERRGRLDRMRSTSNVGKEEEIKKKLK